MVPPRQGSGTYFDGATSVSHAVTLTIEDSAVGIASQDGAQLARWDYPAIVRLPSSPDRLRLALFDSPSAARLDVRDPAFADAIKQHLGFSTPQHRARVRRERRLIVAWSAAAAAAVVAIGIAGLPAIASLLTPLVPPSREARLGATIHQSLVEGYQTKGPVECGDQGERERAGKAVFDQLLQRIESVANLPIPIRAHVIRSPIINAGAIPGGILHFNMGMIEFARSPEELASVMGHELGHLAHRHSLRGHLHRLGLTYLMAVTLGDVLTGGGVILASHNVLQSRYGRAQERQADDYGTRLMAKLGADTHPAADLWDRMAEREKTLPPHSRLTDSHPASAERAAAIRRTPRIADPKPLLSAEAWQVLRGVCSGK